MTILRKTLDCLYKGCALFSGIFFVAIAIFIIYDLCSPLFGYIPKSTDEFAGYCMAASAFLGLGYTFTNNGHIKVKLFAQLSSPSLRHYMELFALLVACGISCFFTWYSIKLAWESWVYNDVSQGLIALPLWIPQSSMAFGSLVFFLAIVDSLFCNLFGSDHQHNNSATSNV